MKKTITITMPSEATIRKMMQTKRYHSQKARKKKAAKATKAKLDRLLVEWQAEYGQLPEDLKNLK